MQQDYSSGSVNVLLSTTLAGRFFKILGSKPARLSWDVDTKTVTITETPRNGAPEKVIVSVPASQVQRAFFDNGAYILRINHQAYHMDVRHYQSQGALSNDILNLETSEFASVLKESKNPTADLAQFLKASMPKEMVYVSRITPKTLVIIAIGIVIIFAGITIAASIIGMLRA